MFTVFGVIIIAVLTGGGLVGIGMMLFGAGDLYAVIILAVFVIGVLGVLFILKPPALFKRK
jgi:hypothetical protein